MIEKPDAYSYAMRYAIALEGSEAGALEAVSGGAIRGQTTIDASRLPIPRKHIGGIRYEDFTVRAGAGSSEQVFEWIQQAFGKGYVARSGEIHACDFEGRSRHVSEFRGAHIAEVTVPALDGSSKESLSLTVGIRPEAVVYRRGDGSQVLGGISSAATKWLASNFRISLGNLPCSRVARVESFTWRLNVAEGVSGRIGEVSYVFAVPDLRLLISVADIAAWMDWHRSCLVEGKPEELNGAIEILAPDLKSTVLRIDLGNVGLISLEPLAPEANKEEIARFAVELYVEQMAFTYSKVDA